jgi:hypothetical protein
MWSYSQSSPGFRPIQSSPARLSNGECPRASSRSEANHGAWARGRRVQWPTSDELADSRVGLYGQLPDFSAASFSSPMRWRQKWPPCNSSAAAQKWDVHRDVDCSASPKAIRKSRRTFVDAAPRLRLEGPPDQCAAAGPALPKERTPRAGKELQNWAGTCRGRPSMRLPTGGHQQLFHPDSRCSGVQWIFM